jgi:hypothetical protein
MPLDRPDPGLPGATKMWTPQLRVRVSGKHLHQHSPSLPAFVDSGSPYCLFHSAVADFLHIDLKSGAQGQLGGVIDDHKESMYFHKVNLTIENHWLVEVFAGFSKKLSVVAILGRSGFFDRFQVRFDHSKTPPEFEVTKIDLIN